MLKYPVLFALACTLSLVLTPIVRALALRIGAVDRPGQRKIHTRPIPRLGGVSVVLAASLTTVLAAAVEGVGDGFIRVDLTAWTPLLLGGSIVFLAGVWDDIRPLSAGTKFLLQAAAAGVAIWLGVRIDQVYFFATGT